MRITFVGTADAFNAAGRNHSAYLIESPGCAPLMIDFGATSLAGLRKLGREPAEIGAFAITHLHGDHVGGFPFLFIDSMYNVARTMPLVILGPRFTPERLERALRVAYGRVADEPMPGGIEVRELIAGAEVELAGYSVRGFLAAHMEPPDEPLCLRVRDPAGTSIAFSGDTEICGGLFDAADGTDLLVAECTQLAPPTGRHITWEHWKKELPSIGAKRVVLSHLGADVRAAIPRLLAEAPKNVRLSFADDGMIVDL